MEWQPIETVYTLRNYGGKFLLFCDGRVEIGWWSDGLEPPHDAYWVDARGFRLHPTQLDADSLAPGGQVMWVDVIDDEILAVRARHAQRLANEHTRMAIARQREETRRIVAEREQRVAASRAHDLVRKAVTL